MPSFNRIFMTRKCEQQLVAKKRKCLITSKSRSIQYPVQDQYRSPCYGELSESIDFGQPLRTVRNERKYVPINEAATTGAK